MCDNCKYTYWREELRKEREKNAILKRFEASATTQAAEAQRESIGVGGTTGIAYK